LLPTTTTKATISIISTTTINTGTATTIHTGAT
jgi:hypothetical protein